MTGSVDQVEFVLFAVERSVEHAHGLRFDGDALLTLQVHLVERLLHQFALRYGSGKFEQTISQGRFAVIDVGDNAEISNMCLICHSIMPPHNTSSPSSPP